MEDKDREQIVANENLESNNTGEDKYEFLTETIKKRPVNKRKILGKLILALVSGVIFALAACVTIAILFPYVKAKINPTEKKIVTIPVAESPEEEIDKNKDSQSGEDDASANETDSLKEEDNQGDDKAVADEDTKEDALTNDKDEAKESLDESGNKGVVVNQVIEKVEKTIEIDDYRELLHKISSVAGDVSKSMVTVSGVASDTDWFNNEYESNNTASGLIVADNGKELLIVSASDILSNAENVEVTFCDGKTYPCTIKKSDNNTNLTVVAVELDEIEDVTMSYIQMANFSSYANASIGTPVIAVGSPYGMNDSVALGQITSNSVIIDKADYNTRIISTDIYGSKSSSGVLAGLNGSIIGFICHEDVVEDMGNLIQAYSISDLSSKIEKISNDQDVAYLGIIGTDVTEDANKKFGVPSGAYVKKVEIDSPAMEAGIRSGDVVTKLGTADIESYDDYKETLLKCQSTDMVNVTVQRPSKDGYIEVTYEVQLSTI